MPNIIEVQTDLQKLTNKKITYTDMGDILGTGRSNISARAKKGSQVTPKELALLEDAYKVKLSDDIRDKILKVNHDFQQIKQRFEDRRNGFINLPVRSEVTASMGYGVEVLDEQQTGTYSFSKKLLRDIGADPNYSDVIFSSGDSMYPTIEGGDCLVVDKSKTDIYDGKIYCVRIQEKLYAKRLQFLPPNKVNVISDNPKYKPFEVDLSKELNYDFAVIGEVKWWSRVAR
jgi:phage repressor protein C with HTH and peptisase S24 domain